MHLEYVRDEVSIRADASELLEAVVFGMFGFISGLFQFALMRVSSSRTQGA